MIATWCFLAAAAPIDDLPLVDFDSAMDQARFFLGRERFADAQEQLELAVGTPVGARDAETWFLLAKVRYERGRLAEAESAADHARRFSRNPSEFSQTQELYSFFRDNFGILVVDGPPGARTSIELQRTSNQLDPELKAYVSKWRTRLIEEAVTVPFTLGVPVGDYLVNGRAVSIGPGRTSVLEGVLTTSSGLGATNFDVAVGGTGWSNQVGLLASGSGELAISVPVAGFTVGVVGQLTAQRFLDDDQVTTGIGGSAGVRGGRIVRLGHPWVLVPALNLRVGRVPGVEAGPEARATGTALFVGPELLASYRRSNHWSIGFSLAGERVAGRLPATAPSGVSIEQRGFGAWLWRSQVSVGYRL